MYLGLIGNVSAQIQFPLQLFKLFQPLARSLACTCIKDWKFESPQNPKLYNHPYIELFNFYDDYC